MSENYNKVVYNGQTLIDLTHDTVNEDSLLAGYTAHGSDGRVVVGAASPGSGGVYILSVEQTVTSTEDEGENVITMTMTDGNTSEFIVRNGSKGHTPQRETDYWTEEDKAEIKSYVDEAILGGAW